MTPDEAVEQLGERLTTSRMRTVKKLMKACVATAKENETRRCAARLRGIQEQSVKCGDANPFEDVLYLDALADDLLITGGLEAEG